MASFSTGVGQTPFTSLPPDQAAGVMSSISSVLSNISSLSADIGALGNAIQELLAQIEAKQATRPQPPPEGASKKERKQYEAELAQWNATTKVEIQALQGQVASLNERIEDLAKRIADATDKLNNLKNIQLPAAQESDRQKAEAQLKAATEQFDKLASKTTDDVNNIDNPEILHKVLLKKIQSDNPNVDPSLKAVIRSFVIVLANMPEVTGLGTKSGPLDIDYSREPAQQPADDKKVTAANLSSDS